MAGDFDYDSFLMFNPEGKIRQLEYLRQATGLGNTCLALSNPKHGVLVAHIPRRSKLAEPQNKVFEIKENALFAFAGITNDGLSIVEYLKHRAIEEDVVKNRSIHYIDVFDDLCVDAARRSIADSSRLYGAAGILMIDTDGVKVVEFDPVGTAREMRGVAIGFRAQSCMTILEDCVDEIADASLDELIRLGIRALGNAHPDKDENTLKVEDVYIYVMEAGAGYKQAMASDYMVSGEETDVSQE
ncbi:20S proteasome subunit alpha 6 [Pancytospora philotis]|nr:20S proteasome subunit alpha 6 [Pancytospora philotis]